MITPQFVKGLLFRDSDDKIAKFRVADLPNIIEPEEEN